MKTGVERLFPFALRASIVVVGRHNLIRLHKHLHFLLITHDISANSLDEIAEEFDDLPIVQCYRVQDIEEHFSLHNTKVLGFRKSTLASNLYRELKHHRLARD